MHNHVPFRVFCLLLLLLFGGIEIHLVAADEAAAQGSVVAFWPLDDGLGKPIRNQQSDDFHGSVTGEGLTWSDGVATFPGDEAGGHLRIPDGGGLLDGPAFAINLDVRPVVADAVGPLLATKSVSEFGGGFNLHYWLQGKRLSFNFADGTKTYNFRFTCRLPLEHWSSIAVRYDGANVVASIDGVEIGRHSLSGAVLQKNPRAPLLIGGYPHSHQCWKGQLRNVRLSRLASAESTSVVRVNSPPQIDGKLDDIAWKNRDFRPTDSDSAIRFALTADDTHLYVAARCDTEKSNAGDSLQISVDPQMTGHRHFRITLSPDNDATTALVGYYGRLIQDQYTISDLATATWIETTSSKGSRWTAEVAVPFHALAVPENNPSYWNFGLRRVGSDEATGSALGQSAMRVFSGVPSPRYTDKLKRRVGSLIYQWKLNDPAPLDVDLRFRTSHDTWLVANNMVVPNWFNVELPAKSIRDFGAHLALDFPEGIELLHVGTFKADSPVKTKLRKSRFTWQKESGDVPVTHAGNLYTRYRVEVAEIHQRINTIGPFYLRSTLPNDTAQTLYFQTVYPGSQHPPEQLELITKAFPTPGPPKKLLASLTWMTPADYMNWPGMQKHYFELGFNALSIQKRDRELLDHGARRLLDRARDGGVRTIAVDSAFHLLKHHDDAHSVLASGRTSSDVCPAYRGPAYQQELQSIASWSAEIQADYLVLDVECFQKGADHGLSQSCSRCADYIAKTKFSPREAMISLGAHIQKDVHQAVAKAHRQHNLESPNIGYYHSKPGDFVYQSTLRFDGSYPHSVGHAQPVFYDSKKNSTGTEIRRMRGLMDQGDLMPWFTPGFFVAGSRPIEYPSAWVYDRVLEGYGNGIRGVHWFTFNNFEAADFYHYAKAMESINPVEALIYDSQPWEDIEVNEPYQASAILDPKTGKILLLISEYTQAESGDVTVTFPTPIPLGFQLYDVARRTKLKAVSGRRITFPFKPGAEGAHTSLFLLQPGSGWTTKSSALP